MVAQLAFQIIQRNTEGAGDVLLHELVERVRSNATRDLNCLCEFFITVRVPGGGGGRITPPAMTRGEAHDSPSRSRGGQGD